MRVFWMKSPPLFNEHDLGQVLETRTREATDAVRKIPPPLLPRDDEGIRRAIDGLRGSYRVDPLALDMENIEVDPVETNVDVSKDLDRHIRDRSQPFYLPGVKVSYYVPFRGWPPLLRCQPPVFTSTVPHAHIEGNHLVFAWSAAGTDVTATKGEFDRQLNLVHRYIEWGRPGVDAFNESLSGIIHGEVRRRVDELQSQAQQVEQLGFKRRSSSPTPQAIAPTYAPAPTPAPAGRPASAGQATARGATSAPRYDVALSFAGEDRAYVDAVAHDLRSRGVAVFYDVFEKGSLWGANLLDHLEAVYSRESRFVVLFISVHYAAKAWPNHERQSALAGAFNRRDRSLLPTRFDDTEIPGLPSTVGYLDLRDMPPAELAQLIVEKLQS